MASPATLDLELLLQPISEAEPSGPELKDEPAQSAVYYRIKDARDTARAAERQRAQATLYGDEAETSSVAAPDWKLVRTLAIEALAKQSKDLWIAAWLIEALVRAHGLAGLRDGFQLTRELCERFWDGIHPRPDDDGYSHTVAQLTGLCGDESEGALVAPILDIPITNSPAFRPLSSADYLQATKLEQIADPDRRAQRIDQGAVTLETFSRAAAGTPDVWYETLLEDLDQCLDEFQRLSQVLDEKCGQNADGYSAAPPTSSLRNTLEECRDRVRSLAPRKPDQPPDGAEPGAATDLATVTGSPARAVATGPVVTREDAFRALLQVADFFQRTEPHSPVSYALKQAVRWGRMSLPELMSELISESNVRQDVFRRIGIPPETPEGG